MPANGPGRFVAGARLLTFPVRRALVTGDFLALSAIIVQRLVGLNRLSCSNMHEQSIQLDAAVLQSLYAAHARALAAYACTLTTSLEEAEDLVHEAFVSVLGSAAWANMPLAYLMRAIRNKAMDQGRAAMARCRAERSTMMAGSMPAPDAAGGVVGETLRYGSAQERAALSDAACAALSALSPAAAEVVTLRTRCGLSFPEIATILDEPVGTVSARYVRAIATIRATLCAGVNHE